MDLPSPRHTVNLVQYQSILGHVTSKMMSGHGEKISHGQAALHSRICVPDLAFSSADKATSNKQQLFVFKSLWPRQLLPLSHFTFQSTCVQKHSNNTVQTVDLRICTVTNHLHPQSIACRIVRFRIQNLDPFAPQQSKSFTPSALKKPFGQAKAKAYLQKLHSGDLYALLVQYLQVGGASLPRILLHPSSPWTEVLGPLWRRPEASITGFGIIYDSIVEIGKASRKQVKLLSGGDLEWNTKARLHPWLN